MCLCNMSSFLFIIFIAILQIRVGGEKALSYEFVVHLFIIKVSPPFSLTFLFIFKLLN